MILITTYDVSLLNKIICIGKSLLTMSRILGSRWYFEQCTDPSCQKWYNPWNVEKRNHQEERCGSVQNPRYWNTSDQISVRSAKLRCWWVLQLECSLSDRFVFWGRRNIFLVVVKPHHRAVLHRLCGAVCRGCSPSHPQLEECRSSGIEGWKLLHPQDW